MNENNACRKPIIAFPHMGSYHIPVRYLLKHILNADIMDSPPITAHTIELGTKYSPDFVCTPFKYTIGTLIESLDKGANVLLQAGGGCRYGYYSELQEEILHGLGYQFEFLNLVTSGKTDIKKIYHELKKIDPKLKIGRSFYYLFITSKMVKYMDKLDDVIRQNIGFEVEKGTFIKIQKKFLRKCSKVKHFYQLYFLYRKYLKMIHHVKIKKPANCLKIGVIGELYTVMEPFANYELETCLAAFGISVKRYTNVHYLVFEKKRSVRKYLRYAKEYVTYRMGADAIDNIGRAKYLCMHGYDGIIHIKSSFCTPEIGAMPIINKICNDYHVPVLFFSFDANTSEVGIKTRLEAFYDMIEMRKTNENRLPRD